METPGKDGAKNPTAEDIRKISDRHIKDVPNEETVPDMPATGGKQFVDDKDKDDDIGAEKKRGDLKP